MRLKLTERFWSRVEKTDGCWYWRGRLSRDGYGHIDAPHSQLAHRLSWEIARGEPPPPDLLVLHTCDNPPCVRPDHLLLGTDLDNVRDAIQKGRRAPMPDNTGEANGQAKLTVDDVRAIRAGHAEGLSRTELAARFDVTKGCVNLILAGKRWRNVQ